MNQVSAMDAIMGVLYPVVQADLTGIGVPYTPEILVEGVDQDAEPDDPRDPKMFVRVRLRHNVSTQRTLAPKGSRKFEEYGLVLVQLLVPWQNGRGLTQAQQVSDLVKAAYRGAVGSVRYSNAHSTEIGRDGIFYQMNVTVNFAYFNYA